MGRYDSITSDVIKNIFEILKENRNNKPESDNIICDCITYYTNHEMEFDIELILKVKKDYGLYIDGCIFDNEDDQIPIITIQILSSDFSNEIFYSQIYHELRDVVRHEIEHLTQRGINQKMGKWMRDNQHHRTKILNGELPVYRYFTLQDEVDANIQGLYSKSKSLKEPFQIVIDRYLDNITERYDITDTERQKIYKIWKKRIPKIGGIPKLK